jgi:hypothetical protein
MHTKSGSFAKVFAWMSDNLPFWNSKNSGRWFVNQSISSFYVQCHNHINSESISQHDAVRFLHSESLPADIIHEHLVPVFGDQAIAYSTVTRTLKELNWTAAEIPKGEAAKLFDRCCHSPRTQSRSHCVTAWDRARSQVTHLHSLLCVNYSDGLSLSKLLTDAASVVGPAESRSSRTKSGAFPGASKCEKAPLEVHSNRGRVLVLSSQWMSETLAAIWCGGTASETSANCHAQSHSNVILKSIGTARQQFPFRRVV